MRGEYYPNITEQSTVEVAKQAPFDAKWRLLAQVEVRCYILISNISGSVKVAPLQILQFPVILPHKFQDAEKFNLQFSDFSEITETADKLRWLRYQKGLRQRDVADYAGIYRSTYIHYEEYGNRGSVTLITTRNSEMKEPSIFSVSWHSLAMRTSARMSV